MKKLIINYISEHMKGYIFILLIFASGIILGAYTANGYGSEITDYMTEFFDSVRRILTTSPADSKEVFESTLSSSLKSSLTIWFFGFTVIGAAGIFFIILKSGFITGFTVSFLLKIYSFGGLPAGAASILLRCIFYFPLLFFLSAEALQLSGVLIKTAAGRLKYKNVFRYHLLRYLVCGVIAIVVSVIYSLFEAYAGSFFISRLIK